MYWYIEVLKKYVVFSGRARRKEYWMFTLISTIITVALAFIDDSSGTDGLIGLAYTLAVFLPSLGVAVRRLHDTDRTGWWVLIGLIPLVGLIVLIIFFVQDSNPEENAYGPNPKSNLVV